MRLSLAALPLMLAAPTLADVPSVATDIAPVHSLVARVMLGVGEPDLVVSPGASPHGYALRPSQAADLARADAVFLVSHALTPWLEGSLETLAADAVVVELLEAPGTTVLSYRDQISFGEEEHDDHEGHDDHDDHDADEDHGHDDHDHEGEDPHAWLDPENARAWLEVIAGELTALDPGNAEIYRTNAAAAQADLAAMSAEIADRLQPLAAAPFITFHDAYQYFEARFGLNGAGAISLGDASAPSAARVAAVRDLVAERGVVCVFSEPQFNPALVETVLDGTGAVSAVIDPIGAHIEPGPDFYPALLSSVAAAMASCL